MSRIRIKAGKNIYQIIKDGGFNFDSVSTYFGPAVGPRWLIASGFDLTLLKGGFLGRSKPAQLVGASAGAFRFAAWLQPQAIESYQKLLEAYINVTYKKQDTPSTSLGEITNIVNVYLEDDALPFALANKKYRLVIITARARGLVAYKNTGLQKLGLAACFVFNYFNRENIYKFAERVVFYNASKPPAFCLRSRFRGTYVQLNEVNFKYAVLASGAIPLVIEGVRDIYGAPRGVYRDGGLIDYHLTHQFAAKENEIVLFFHHQERIIPGWLDKNITRRVPEPYKLNNVLMVFPAQSFIESLPDGKVPDRTDLLTFINDQETRIKNWRKAVELSAPLGEEFLELVESGKIKDIVEKI
ncbi:MAG: hypothetical protein CVU52_10525 [Deltaproteobacteria bacterium HGW-Deltaproteobacteria-10]|jgi:hypothetical protein|nr:MAG: hypothetical protein CVU62_01315 [Deltaproteobacteria bacterium HGW-Deltaproteobacteria-2]PKN67000.1 MAG: hypothetical protein CVU52_10525 [Deltaproteobacteria bacterium HGW-Deltaproteobacteria-10]